VADIDISDLGMFCDRYRYVILVCFVTDIDISDLGMFCGRYRYFRSWYVL